MVMQPSIKLDRDHAWHVVLELHIFAVFLPYCLKVKKRQDYWIQLDEPILLYNLMIKIKNVIVRQQQLFPLLLRPFDDFR